MSRDLYDREIADLHGDELAIRLRRETRATVPIEWDHDGDPVRKNLTVKIVAFLGGLHINAYSKHIPYFGPGLLPLTDHGMGRGVPWGTREPGTDGWMEDIWPSLLAAVEPAVRLVEAHAANGVCTARIGFNHQVEELRPVHRRWPYRCQLATHDRSGRHQHGRFIWTENVPPVDGNGAMLCAPEEGPS